MGPFQLFTVLFGTIIGVAWIVATGMWIGEAGPLGAIIAFGIGALVMWLIGLCFAEMMTLYPDANGSMAYVFEAFGERAAAAAGWFLVLTYSATCAWFFVTVSWLAQAAVPWIGGPKVYATFAGDVHLGEIVLGLAAAVAITLVNLRGVSARAAFQDALVVAKIAIGIALFVAALLLGRAERLEPVFAASTPHAIWLSIASVAATTPFFFAGFDVLPQAVRDRRPGTPLRVIATVISIATFLAFVFYSGAILSASAALERTVLRESTLPVVEAFSTGMGQPWLGFLVIVAGICGILTGWNACLLSGARVLQGMAQAGVTLPFFAVERVRDSGTSKVPVRATLFIAFLAAGLGMMGRQAAAPIVDIVAIPLLICFVLVCAGVIRLRRTRPDAERPYRVPGGLMLVRLALLLSAGLIVAALVPVFLSARGYAQWVFLVVWSLVGLVFWRMAAGYRATMTAEKRKACVLGGES